VKISQTSPSIIPTTAEYVSTQVAVKQFQPNASYYSLWDGFDFSVLMSLDEKCPIFSPDLMRVNYIRKTLAEP
jgi:hypothetical protein